jgi:hypothetical protein
VNAKRSKDVIAPSLFDYVLEYAKDIVSGDKTISSSVDGDSTLIVFAENFLTQFADGYLGLKIVGFNSRSQGQLKVARRRLERGSNSDQTKAAQHLMFQLEPLCDLVAEISYGNSEIEAESFHTELFPEFLEQIELWLEEYPASQALRDAVGESVRSYNQAIERE